MTEAAADKDKSTRGHASQFFIAGELCRRALLAVVTMGNTPNTDILCSNKAGTRFVHIQVKTFVPGKKTCSVGMKAERPYGEAFFWVLGGIPLPTSMKSFEYYVIPAREMAHHVATAHQSWLKAPGKNARPHQDNTVRTVFLPPAKSPSGWDIHGYRDRWDLIEAALSN